MVRGDGGEKERLVVNALELQRISLSLVSDDH